MICIIQKMLGSIINFILKRTIIMATIEEVSAEVSELKSNLEGIDTTLDAVAEKISALVAGQVDQGQIDALAQLVSSAKSLSSAVKDEASALVSDEVAPDAGEPSPTE